MPPAHNVLQLTLKEHLIKDMVAANFIVETLQLAKGQGYAFR